MVSNQTSTDVSQLPRVSLILDQQPISVSKESSPGTLIYDLITELFLVKEHLAVESLID